MATALFLSCAAFLLGATLRVLVTELLAAAPVDGTESMARVLVAEVSPKESETPDG